MKLASLKNGTRDGALVVVSTDLTHCERVPGIATSLQQALDQWVAVEPRLREVAAQLASGKSASAQPFDPNACHSPLPRAYQFVDGSAYLNHVELVRRARGATVPQSFYSDPLMYQGSSDSFVDPTGVLRSSESWGIDFEGEVAVVTGDVPMGSSPSASQDAIRLVMLMNDVSLRELLRSEITKELGFVQSKPSSSFAPVAVTLDELGDAWCGGKVCLPVTVQVNGKLFGRPNAGLDMNFDFGQLIAHAAKTRDLAAGTIVGGGTVSNKQDSLWGSSIENGGVGYCCLAELRMYEAIELGQPRTPFLQNRSDVRIEVFDPSGNSLFGAIHNRVESLY